MYDAGILMGKQRERQRERLPSPLRACLKHPYCLISGMMEFSLFGIPYVSHCEAITNYLVRFNYIYNPLML